ncbi:MAG: EAL domain-containing protein [Rhodospirillaceae bacterium]|nr:EAL domain-containing protein [Rhodospirillaceae bacterium]
MIPLLMTGIFALVFHYYTLSAADTTASRIMRLWLQSVENHLNEFLGKPSKLNLVLAQDIGKNGIYHINDLRNTETLLRREVSRLIQNHDAITYVGFGGSVGEFVGFRRNATNSDFSLTLKDFRTNNIMRSYQGGTLDSLALSEYPTYDARRRPWYKAAITAGGAAWSPIYTNRDHVQDLTIASVLPITGQHGDLLGVIETDISLNRLNIFLQDIKGNSHGEIAIIDTDGCLVAHSRRTSVASESDHACGTTDARRIPANASPSPMLAKAWRYATEVHHLTTGRFELSGDDGRIHGLILPYNSQGLHWNVVVALPESEVLGNIRQSERDVLILAVLSLFVSSAFGLWLVNRLARPIRQTAQAANDLARGEWPGELPEQQTVTEAAELVHAFNTMSERLEHSFGRLREQICIDTLTGQLTRIGFIEAFSALASQNRGPAIMVRLGLDNFRAINDSVGYHTGDVLLAAASERIRNVVGNQGLIGRFAGDEFVILTMGSPADALTLVHQLAATFAAPFALSGDEILISASIGYCCDTLTPDSHDPWMRQSGLAMTAAKRRGPGSSIAFSPDMEAVMGDNLRLASDLSHALSGQQLCLHYQPIHRLSNRALVGCEALLRWKHPTRGWISPGQFIPLAEETPLILTLGSFVLETACQQMRTWIDDGTLPPKANMHVNVSGRQLLQSDFVQEFQDVVVATGLPPHNISLEVTESCLLPQGVLGMGRLSELRSIGANISIDDFGTGYSSLAYLHQVPFTCLKLDQSFVHRLAEDETSRSIVAAVTHLSRAFSAEVIAEGIETTAQLNLLRSMGCTLGQGFLLGRPMSAEDFAKTARSLPATPPSLL